jgi:hypothetical protein
MLSQAQHDEPGQLSETKIALRKLVEVYNRINSLMAKRFDPKTDEYSSLLTRSSDTDKIEREVRSLNEGLSALIRMATRRQQSFKNVLEMAKRFEESNSVEEICTLIGLTMLADYKGHADGLNQVAKICESKIYPSIPILTNLMIFAGELEKVCVWTHEILNYDPATEEDDIIRMISALKNRDLDQFNSVYEKLDQRLKIEESQ